MTRLAEKEIPIPGNLFRRIQDPLSQRSAALCDGLGVVTRSLIWGWCPITVFFLLCLLLLGIVPWVFFVRHLRQGGRDIHVMGG